MLSGTTTKQKQLAELTATKLTEQLDFAFSFKCQSFNFISQTLKDHIYKECLDILASLQLSNTQLQILEVADLELLSNKLAGTIEMQAPFNLVFNHGITTTGLTKIYYYSISCKIKRLFYHSVTGAHSDHNDHKIATDDQLKNNSKLRKKSILTLLGSELLSLSTLNQAQRLCEEIKNPDNSYILELRQPRLIGKFFCNGKNTRSYISYESQLFNLNCCTNLLIQLIHNHVYPSQNLALELACHTTSFFATKEQHLLARSLPCINKKMAETKKEIIETFRGVYRRN